MCALVTGVQTCALPISACGPLPCASLRRSIASDRSDERTVLIADVAQSARASLNWLGRIPFGDGSHDLDGQPETAGKAGVAGNDGGSCRQDRMSVERGKGGSVSLDCGGRRIHKK